MHDCVVVGAGLAGLAAADDLVRRGFDVAVLEARERPGGRLLTETAASGDTIELGGQWIMPGQDRMFELIERAGLDTVSPGPGDALVSLRGTASRVGTASDEFGMTPFEVADLGQGMQRFHRLAARARGNSAWAQANAAWLGQPLSRWVKANLRTSGGQTNFLRVMEQVVDDPGTSLDEALSASTGVDLDALVPVHTTVTQERVAGGLAAVTDHLAAALGERVSFASRVSGIKTLPDSVVVQVAGGPEVEARVVLLTVPAHLVSEITFEPALPAWRADVVAGVPRGNVIKAAMVFERAWWRDQNWSGQVSLDSGALRVLFDSTDGPHGVLMGYFEGPEASGMGKWSVSLRQRSFLDVVRQVFGPDVPAPIAYTDLDWSVEEFTGGCHGAHFAPSAWAALAGRLAAPEGRAFFAGAEYSARFTGFCEGAVRSGLDAASQISRYLA